MFKVGDRVYGQVTGWRGSVIKVHNDEYRVKWDNESSTSTHTSSSQIVLDVPTSQDHPTMTYEFGQQVEIQSGNDWEPAIYLTFMHQCHTVLGADEVHYRKDQHIRAANKSERPWLILRDGPIVLSYTDKKSAMEACEQAASESPGKKYYVVQVPAEHCICDTPKPEWRKS